jgi:hypothetical protein
MGRSQTMDEISPITQIPAMIAATDLKPAPGQMRAHLFQNPRLGLAPTLFYDIAIPLEPFDSGLAWEDQPVHTQFCLEFVRLPVDDWRELDGRSFALAPGDADGSIYLGGAHNPVDIQYLGFTRLAGTALRIDCTLFCDFEAERVGDSLLVQLTAEVEFQGLIVERDILGSDPTARRELEEAIGTLVALDAYEEVPRVGQGQVWLVAKTQEGGPVNRCGSW